MVPWICLDGTAAIFLIPCPWGPKCGLPSCRCDRDGSSVHVEIISWKPIVWHSLWGWYCLVSMVFYLLEIRRGKKGKVPKSNFQLWWYFGWATLCEMKAFLYAVWNSSSVPEYIDSVEKSHGWRSLVGCSPWCRRVGHDWATSLSLFTSMHWRRKWQPTPVFLPGESQGWGSLVGCRLWGRTESDMTEAT